MFHARFFPGLFPIAPENTKLRPFISLVALLFMGCAGIYYSACRFHNRQFLFGKVDVQDRSFTVEKATLRTIHYHSDRITTGLQIRQLHVGKPKPHPWSHGERPY